MEDLIQLDRPVEVGRAHRSYRGVTLLAIIALVLGGLVLASHAPGPVKSDHKVVKVVDQNSTNGGATLGKTLGFGAVQPQIAFGGLVCSIIDQVIASFPPSLVAFVAAALMQVRVLFGCVSQ